MTRVERLGMLTLAFLAREMNPGKRISGRVALRISVDSKELPPRRVAEALIEAYRQEKTIGAEVADESVAELMIQQHNSTTSPHVQEDLARIVEEMKQETYRRRN